VFFICLFAICPFRLQAYCPDPEIRPNGEFFKANSVFTGRVISARTVPDKGDAEGGWFYTLRVNETFRGPVLREFTVFTGDDSNRFPLEVGSKYLLFAYRRHHRFVIDDCGNSALLSEANGSLSTLRNLRDGKLPSEIEGWIAAETEEIDVSGVAVAIQGPSKRYSAISDKDGWFHFQAPPGNYRVDFGSKQYYVNSLDDLWYNPGHFLLHSGECVSLQLVSARHVTR